MNFNGMDFAIICTGILNLSQKWNLQPEFKVLMSCDNPHVQSHDHIWDISNQFVFMQHPAMT